MATSVFGPNAECGWTCPLISGRPEKADAQQNDTRDPLADFGFVAESRIFDVRRTGVNLGNPFSCFKKQAKGRRPSDDSDIARCTAVRRNVKPTTSGLEECRGTVTRQFSGTKKRPNMGTRKPNMCSGPDMNEGYSAEQETLWTEAVQELANIHPDRFSDRFALKIFDAIQFEYENADHSEIILENVRLLFDRFIESRMGIAALPF